jgi:hypothetical protein
MGWRLVEHQIPWAGRVCYGEPLQKDHNMHRQLAIVINEEPAAADGIQGSKAGTTTVDPRRGHAPARPFHPHRAEQRQEMQLRFVQIEQMTSSQRGRPAGGGQGRQFGLGLTRLPSRGFEKA